MDLCIDEFFVDLLVRCPSYVNNIECDIHGRWTPIVNEQHSQQSNDISLKRDRRRASLVDEQSIGKSRRTTTNIVSTTWIGSRTFLSYRKQHDPCRHIDRQVMSFDWTRQRLMLAVENNHEQISSRVFFVDTIDCIVFTSNVESAFFFLTNKQRNSNDIHKFDHVRFSNEW
jgi:hypothetical protein